MKKIEIPKGIFIFFLLEKLICQNFLFPSYESHIKSTVVRYWVHCIGHGIVLVWQNKSSALCYVKESCIQDLQDIRY